MSQLISSEYKELLQKLHTDKGFGERSKLPSALRHLIEVIQPKSILDFGCGKGKLVNTLRHDYPDIQVYGYDPGNSEFDIDITSLKVDLLISTDVLEHIEPDYIDETLSWLSTKSKFIYHLISCAPAKRKLADGRNAHLIQQGPEWWRPKFQSLGYTILDENYKEFEKRPGLLVKHYVITAEKND